MIKMKNIRILTRNIRDGIKNVIRNFSLSMASISCITVTLLLVAIAMIGSLNVENFTKIIRDDFTIVTYIKTESDENKESEIKQEIEKMNNIESVTFDSKKDIAERMKKESEVFNDIMSSWNDDENPLYDTYLVKVKDSEKISLVAKKIEKIDGVAMVKYGEGMIDSLISIFKIVEKILIVMVVSLVVVTAFLIINTIKITIFSIKQPFVIEGLFIGLLGSIIPVLSTIYGYTALYEKTGGKLFSQFIKLVKPYPFVFMVSGILVLIGVVVGMVGSSSAVRKYLKI